MGSADNTGVSGHPVAVKAAKPRSSRKKATGNACACGMPATHGAIQGYDSGVPIVYVGLESIGKAVGAGVGTVKRWIRDEAFPARRCPDGIYRADPDVIRAWFHPPFPGMSDSETSRRWAKARSLQPQNVHDHGY